MSPIVMNRISWKVLSSPRVERPTMRVISQRNPNMAAARTMISMVPCSGDQGGADIDVGDRRVVDLDFDGGAGADLRGGLDVGVVVDGEVLALVGPVELP